MSDRNPPRLIATSSDAELARSRAEQDVSWAIREITANLLRVVRGAGKPYEIVAQLDEFSRALREYRDACGNLAVMDLFPAILSFRTREQLKRELTGRKLERFCAEETVVRGALQIAASRLLGQTTQETAGESELHDGMRRFEEARLEARLERDHTMKTAAKAARSVLPRKQKVTTSAKAGRSPANNMKGKRDA